MEEEKVQKEQMAVAQMRFGMIAPVIQGTYPDASVCAYCRRVSTPRSPYFFRYLCTLATDTPAGRNASCTSLAWICVPFSRGYSLLSRWISC